MDKIKVKPVTEQFWILQKNNEKIGRVIQYQNGYMVNINGKNADSYKSLKDLKESKLFEFVELKKPKASVSHDVLSYPTEGIAYNALWNLKYKLPLFTLTADSKSWHAAGYYVITIKGSEEISFCPKLITLQRNKYTGPFKIKPELQFDKLFDELL